MPDEANSSAANPHILLAVNPDEPAMAAARVGAALADRLGLAKELFHVAIYSRAAVLEMKAMGTGEVELAREKAAKSLTKIHAELGDGCTETVRVGEVGDEIRAVTRENPPFAIVVGRRPLGTIGGWLLGRVSEEIVGSVEHPVLIVPHDATPPTGLWRWVMAIDFGAESAAALALAQTLGRDPGCEIVALHVQEGGEGCLAKLEERVKPLVDAGVKVRVRCETGPPLEVIPKIVEEEEATGLIVAAHKRTGLEAVLVGSVTKGLLKTIRRPMFVAQVCAARPAESGGGDSGDSEA